MNIKEILEYGKNNLIDKDEPYRLAKMLLKYVMNIEDSYLILHSDDELDNEIINKYQENIDKLKNGLPIQYITHNQEFMKLDFYVDENVLIPQPDTEVLVEEVINISRKLDTFNSIDNFSSQMCYYNNPQKDILDMCTGSGAIGISLAKYIKNSNITMVDISENALKIAKKNAEKNNVINNSKFVLSNMFENIEEKFDFIVSNPPYIKKTVIDNLSDEVKNEPIIALDGGEDGLVFYKIIANEAHKYLRENGVLALEIGYDQKDDVINLLNNENMYTDIYCKKDLSDNDRVVICKVK